MRSLVYSLLMFWFASAAHALTIEAERHYGTEKATPDLQILSSADIDVFDPVLSAYTAANKSLHIRYVTTSTADIFEVVRASRHGFDLVLSSAMDLQMKLANDGYTLPVFLSEKEKGPAWSHWQDKVFGFSLEPIGMVISKSHFPGNDVPNNRRALISFLRANHSELAGKVATYDVAQSGAGFLFATQDARQSDSFWRLAEVMGSLKTRMYCCSGQMLDAVNEGELLLAYNIIGSYAEKRSRDLTNLRVIYPQDYTHMLLRTALVPRQANAPEQARDFLKFLLSGLGQAFIEENTGMLSLTSELLVKNRHFRPIRLDTGLLVYLDRLKQDRFLDEWKEALIQ